MPENKAVNLNFAIGLPPEKVIEYFNSKGYAFSGNWQDIWQEAHAKAFTVSRILKLDVLKAIRGEVQKSIESGLTFKEFQKNLQPLLVKKGFWGRVVNEEGKETFITPHRLKTIYQTNIQSAYMAGRYREMIENADDRPYWEYLAVMDGLTRPAHAALDGKVFRYDDPFWNTHYPPNGFNCRCRVRALRAEQLESMNITPEVTKEADFETITQNSGGRPAEITRYIDPKTGVRMAPDAGWNYNPGEAAYMPNFDKYEYAEAKACVNELLNGPALKMALDGKVKINLPVAVLSAENMNIIGANSQTVYLSDETVEKNTGRHREMGIDEYRQIPDLIENKGKGVIVKDTEKTMIFAKRNGKILYAAIKRTESGETLFLKSFRYSNEADIAKARKKGTIIKDDL